MSFAFVGRNALRSVIGWILGAVLLLFAAAPAWSALATDVIVSTSRSTSGSNVKSPSFSTTSAAELLLAFVATDADSPGMTVTSMSGAGLNWVLVRRTNAQLGTAEIWRAFAPAKLSAVSVQANLSQSVAASITVVTFTGADTSGTSGAGAIGATGSGNANPGAPSASLVTTRDNSWVFGVGNDWDNATLRTVPSDQTMVNQYLATVGDTYWVQRQNGPTASSGTTATINDTGPTADRYNLTMVEVRAAPPSGATYAVSGAITPTTSGGGATLTLSGASAATVTADTNGNYTFTNLANGSYTVTPSKAGFTFTPANQVVTVNGANVTAVNFSAAAATYSIAGTITGGGGATVALSGAATAMVTADSNGNYTFTGLANGSYTVTPTKTGYAVSPTSRSVTIGGANVPGVNFAATPVTASSISGTVSPLPGGSAAVLTLTGAANATLMADGSGNYAFANLANGSYTITPSKTGYTFVPASRAVTISGANVSGVNFTDQSVGTGISLVQNNAYGSEATISTASVAFPSNNTPGNLLVVTGTASRPRGTLVISDTAGNSYGVAVGPITDPVQDVTAYVWYVPSCNGGPNTVTITPSTPGALEIHVSEYSGADPGAPLDQTSAAAGNGPNVSSGTRTTTANGELIVGYSFVGATSSSIGSGFSGLSYVNGDWDEYQIQGGAGNVTATFVQPSGPWLALMATFRPPGGLDVATDWLTVNHDPSRSGRAADETTISPSNVGNLQLTWSTLVDGAVTAQPLFVHAIQIAGQARDVLVAATGQNSIYALDASNGNLLWKRNFGPPTANTYGLPDGFGVEATPVIDRVTARIYTVSADGVFRTISLLDGTDVLAPLVLVSNPATNSVWGGLNKVYNSVYLATGSNGGDVKPWRGQAYQIDVSGSPFVAGNFQVVPGIPAPNGGGGIWGSGGVAADLASGNIYAASAFDSNQTTLPYADRMIALDPHLNLLGSYGPPPNPTTYFCDAAPCDLDFASTPVVFQPTLAGCSAMVASGSKNGNLYVFRTSDLIASGVPLQVLALNVPSDPIGSGGVNGVAAFSPADNMLYIGDAGPGLPGIAAGVVGLRVTSSSDPNPCTLQVAWSQPLGGQGVPNSSPTVANGVVFVGEGLTGVIHAYDAQSGQQLWQSGASYSAAATFAAPIVAGGKVYAASWTSVTGGGTVGAFSLSSSPPPPPPPTVLFGDQGIESLVDYDEVGVAEAFSVTASASGSVSSLAVYLDATSQASQVDVGLYADNGGHPGQLLVQGSSNALTAGAWNTIPVTPVTSGANNVAANARYWIALLARSGGPVFFRDRAGGTCTSETSPAGQTALPLNWSTGAVYPDCISAYGN